jgi:hypothetical protein
MIALIPNLPDNVLGLVTSSRVTASDYETVLVPAIESTMARHGRVRILYQLGRHSPDLPLEQCGTT